MSRGRRSIGDMGYLTRIAEAFAEGIEKWAARQERSRQLAIFGLTVTEADDLASEIMALGFTPERAVEVLTDHVRQAAT